LMKQALCLQHVPFEGPGVFERILKRQRFNLTRRLVPAEGLPPDAGDFLLVMGGPMSANDPDPWIQQELKFIRDVVDAGVPFLGVCLGSQMLAKAMGGRVYKGPAAEIGMTGIELTREGRHDPLLDSFPDVVDVVEWHGEGIELPPHAITLASSANFPVQAFRCGTSALGLLFHIELDPKGLEALCRHCPEDLARAGLTAASVEQTALPHMPPLHEMASHLIERLVNA
jgi:GMP synthase (glutamine-hydrolysing)